MEMSGTEESADLCCGKRGGVGGGDLRANASAEFIRRLTLRWGVWPSGLGGATGLLRRRLLAVLIAGGAKRRLAVVVCMIREEFCKRTRI